VLGLGIEVELAITILQLVGRERLLCRLKIAITTSQWVTVAELVGHLLVIILTARKKVGSKGHDI
jgi:hypothetical protein